MDGKRLVVAVPHGFCSGVSRAVESMEKALDRYRPPVYCYHEIVHNRQVVEALERRGAIFVKSMDQVPPGATLLFSAHGVAPEVRNAARCKRLRVVDATCPFVAKAHAKVQRLAARGYGIVLIGHRHHEEVRGVAAECGERAMIVENEAEARALQVPDPERVGVVTQTTLSVSFVNGMIGLLRERFPRLVAPAKGDICYATQNRQRAVEAVANVCDLVLVLGSNNSSNSRRLVEIARDVGKPAFLIGRIEDLDAHEWSLARTVGLTSGASSPEDFWNEVLTRLASRGYSQIEELVVARENPRGFSPPEFPAPQSERSRP